MWAALLVLSFAQQPGTTTFDTKFDLTADPGAFLARSLHLWNDQSSFGELQNQAYGYLFPQGAFFLAGDVLGLPDWVAQRLWSAALLIVAYDGARRLAIAMRPQQRSWTAILAGLAYATAPRLLGLVGVLSAEIVPTAVLPWVVLPLVLAQRGLLTIRAGALLSGVATLFMGGVNAVENLAALPLPALVVLCGIARPGGRRLAVWWAGAMAAACAWWMLPLLVLGRYSPPFLDYIETSVATTRPLGWTNVARGADHWLAYIFVGGRPWWPAAYDLATQPWLIGLTGLVAAISLVGLFHPTMPWRLPLALSALLGLACLTVAHGGPLGSPLAEPVRWLLDGPLSMLRNVHKVDPLVRLPLALGFAHAAAVGCAVAARGRRVVVGATLVALTAVLLASAQPLFTDRLRKAGWDEVPQAWLGAIDYLEEHSGGRRALVLPGSGFGQQWWGWTIDEPIQGLARSPWATRSQIPLTPGQTIRFLDSTEERIEDGVGSPVLADVLARAGISHVVVRRDVDLLASGVPDPDRVDLAISRTPGLVRAASFGSSGFGEQPMIDVYAVDREVPLADAVLENGVQVLAGGPEDIITALESGVLHRNEPTVVSGDGWEDGAPDLVGDGYRRRERQFGRLHDAVSQIMPATEPFRLPRAANDYPGVEGARRVHARYGRIAGIRASSSSGYADALGPVRPELGPFSAVDGVRDTFWRSAQLEDPVGQWIEIGMRRPEPLERVEIVAGVDGRSGLPVRGIEVRAGAQLSTHEVDPVTGRVTVALSGAPVDQVRITVTRTLGDPRTGVVAIREVRLPGLRINRTFVVPPAGADASTSFVLRARPHRRACVDTGIGPHCDPALSRPSEEERQLSREITVGAAGRWRVEGKVVARQTRATTVLTDPVTSKVRVRGSSVLDNDPAVAPGYAFDGDPSTPWLAARDDRSPSLGLRWNEPRVIWRLLVDNAQAPAISPTVAVIRSRDEERWVKLGSDAFGTFEPIRAKRVTIAFPRSEPAESEPVPVGLGEVRIDGLDELKHVPNPRTSTGAICGIGPEINVDGRVYAARVDGRLGDVTSGLPLRLRSCDGPIRLSPGTHRISVRSTEQFAATALTLVPLGERAAPSVVRREVTVERWESNQRSLRIDDGGAALLRVPENVNAGWQARLDGRLLESTRVDGWQQGFRVPAGPGGEITLVFAPDEPYRLALLIGGLAAVVLVGAAGLGLLRDRSRATTAGRAPVSAGLGDQGVIGTWRWWSVLPAVAAGLLLGGVAVAVGTLLGVALRTRPRASLVVAGTLVAAAAVLAAVWSTLDRATGAPLAADGLAGLGIGLLVMTLLRWPPHERAEKAA